MEETIDYNFIAYSNHFEFSGVKLAFRKKELFNISATPKYIPKTDNGWWIGRNLLTEAKVKEFKDNGNIKAEPIKIDISSVQWFRQIELHECFNLNK